MPTEAYINVPEECPDPESIFHSATNDLYYADPRLFDCSHSSKLIQVSFLNKGSSFSDENLTPKTNEELEIEAKVKKQE
jgi:hypothetical protein